MDSMRNLRELMDVHVSLREMFAKHRDLVVGLEFRTALDALRDFDQAVRQHIEDEETHILPRYETLSTFCAGGRPEYFRSEHMKILDLLAELLREAESLAGDGSAGRRRAHEFLDRESPFLNLLHHHEQREERFLYPEMERLVRSTDVEELLSRCTLFPLPKPTPVP